MIPKGSFIVCLTIIIVNARDVSTAYYWSSSADNVQFAVRHCYPRLLVMGTFPTSLMGFLFILGVISFQEKQRATVLPIRCCGQPRSRGFCAVSDCGQPRSWNCNIIPLSLLMLLE